MCPTSRMIFQTYLPPVKPGGALLNLSPVYTPLPSLQIAPQPTQLVRRQNVSILCLLQNLPSQPLTHCIHLSPIIPNCSCSLSFAPEKVGKFLAILNSDCNWTRRHQLTYLKNLLCCSCTASLCPFHPSQLPQVIFHLLGNQPTSQYYIRRNKN